MVLHQTTINQIDDLYKPSGSFIFNYLIPIIIISIWLYNVIGLLIQIELNASKTDWKTSKCTSKYLFISGLIQPEPGLGKIGSTRKNFKECVMNLIQ
jgi:hypothetical protein